MDFPNWDEKFVIEADASSRVVAAVLSQRNQETGQLHPVDFFSSSLSKAQRNYSAGQLEAWALVAACRKWRTYLRATGEVELITDHCPLRWLRNQKDPRRTFARWILELEEYVYHISHRPGNENQLPDYLSRSPDVPEDVQVQDESGFEDKVFSIGATENRETRVNPTRAQSDDTVVIDAIRQLRKTGKVSSGQLRNLTRGLKVVEGVLLFEGRMVVPTPARQDVLGKVHAGGHFGQKRTLQILRKSYFWVGMAQDTRMFCRNCLVCQQAKCSNQRKVPLREFKMEGVGPCDLVAMDIATLPWSDDKFRYFLCIVDAFTRYIELIPLKDQSSASIVREFQRGWIFRGHGVPKGLLTDQAHNIDGTAIRALCEELGIEKRHSSPYHPQGDGLVERAIGQAKQVARCLTLDRSLPKESWPEVLPEVAFYCNNAENSSTKFSPQLLMFGRQPVSPIDAVAVVTKSQWSKTVNYPEHVKRAEKISAELKALAGDNDRIAKQVRNRYHNTGVGAPQFKKGDLVLEKNETRKDSLDRKFHGPYRVIDVWDTSVKIQKGRKRKWIHASRCKCFPESSSAIDTTELKPDLPVTGKPPPERASPVRELVVVSSHDITQEEASNIQSEPNVVLEEVEEGASPPRENQSTKAPVGEEDPIRRYPLRTRKQKDYQDYIL